MMRTILSLSLFPSLFVGEEINEPVVDDWNERARRRGRGRGSAARSVAAVVVAVD